MARLLSRLRLRVLACLIPTICAVVMAGVGMAPAEDDTLKLPEILSMTVGEVRTVRVESVQRVAIGNPQVADVTLISERELLVRALSTGETNLIVWDHNGQQTARLTIAEHKPEHATGEIGRLLTQLGLSGVSLKQEGDKSFLIGQVDSDTDSGHLEQLLSAYPGVTNLVTVRPRPASPEVVPQSVQLAVQVIELGRDDLEKLGVKWSESVDFTETTLPSGLSLADSIMRIGEKASRTNFKATLNALVRKNRARILAEPKLVTSSGKEATSFMGQEIPIISGTATGVGTGTVSSNVEFKQVGVTLKILPTVLADQQRIKTHLEAEVSFIDTSTAIQVGSASVPGVKTRKVQTEVVTGAGETIFIAGLLQADETRGVDQVPALGSIPVVGRLFRSPTVENRRTDLVITVTPELTVDKATEAERHVALEQALASAEVSGAVEDPRLRYALSIQERIAKAIHYPQRERELNLDGRVKLRLHVFADGTLGRAVVSESSGLESLDMEALKAAESQAPYPAFPSQIVERDMWLEVPVIFRPS